MIKLNLPDYSFNIKRFENQLNIFDSFRKKFVKLTKEEWVRQNFLMFLVNEKHFPSGLIAVEQQLKLNGMDRRADIVVYDSLGRARMIVECKAFDVELNQDVAEQIAGYNAALKVDFLVLTNGMIHYCFKLDFINSDFSSINFFPEYKEITNYEL